MNPNEKPPEPPTVKLDKDEITRQLLDKVLLKLTEVGDGQDEFRTGLATLGSKVDLLVTSHQVVASDVDKIKSEQVEIREWKGAVEERFRTHSIGARTLSVTNDAQDAMLQELKNHVAKQAESSMRAILAEVTTAAKVVAKTPLGQRVAKAAGYAALAFFVLATAYFGVLTSRLQSQPQQQSTVVNMAGPVPADAGVDR